MKEAASARELSQRAGARWRTLAPRVSGDRAQIARERRLLVAGRGGHERSDSLASNSPTGRGATVLFIARIRNQCDIDVANRRR